MERVITAVVPGKPVRREKTISEIPETVTLGLKVIFSSTAVSRAAYDDPEKSVRTGGENLTPQSELRRPVTA